MFSLVNSRDACEALDDSREGSRKAKCLGKKFHFAKI